MIIVPLIAVPNQNFTITLDNILFNISIKSVINFMTIDISQNNSVVLSGMRMIPDALLIPYKYLEAGNFVVVTANEEYPIYTEFGATQFMFYFTQAELEAIRGASV